MDGISKASPDDGAEPSTFVDGSTRSTVALPSMLIGKGVYRPGWRWSRHVGDQTGRESARHVGYVMSGRFMIEDSAGNRCEVGPGEAFEVGPAHDAWVIGDEAYVALDFRAT